MQRAAQAIGCALPLIQGGMTGIGTARLAAAVSNAGGLGLVSAGGMTSEAFAREIEAAASTTQSPVGVNIPVTRDAEWMERSLAAALARRPAVVVLGGGNPAPWVPRIADAGVKWLAVVSSARQAFLAQRAGAAAVIAEGNEAGGKNGLEELGLLTLVPLVVREVDVPVFAAGSIVDGATAAAAICLGAGGVQLGTRFMLSQESPLHAATREFLTSQPRSTLLIGRAHGMNRRAVRNPASEEVARREKHESLEAVVALLSGRRSLRGLREGDVDDGLISAGQGVALIRDVPPVADIVERLFAEMAGVLGEAAVQAGEFARATARAR
jgi:enoyl-[acyl-carrier protein] reductase II